MSDDCARPGPEAPVRCRRACLASGIVVVWLLFGCVSLATHTLLPVDETRYVGVAWNMWLRGDFLVPWLNGMAYHHKPPLLFWVFHAGWALTGVNDWWPRVAPGLFGLAATALTFRIARKLWPDDQRAAELAPIVLVGCLWWSLFAAATMFDMLIACFTVLGMLGIIVAAEGRIARGFALVGIALGLGLLSKGPTILLQVLPAALLGPWWMAQPPQRGWRVWYGATFLAVIVGAAIVLAWAVPAALRGGPEYARMIFWGQTADRMVESFAHRAPFWWYAAMAPAMTFPWLFWPPLWHVLRRLPARLDPGLRFAIAWSAPVFVAFSAISGKQAHYLLPLLPAGALLAARLLSAAGAVLERRSQLLPATLAIVAGITVGVLPMFAHGSTAARWIADMSPLGGAGMIAWGLLMLLPRRPRLESAAALLAGISVVAVITGDVAVLRAAGAAYDQRPLARHLKDLESRGIPLAHLGKYHGQYQFLGRLERSPEIITADQAADWFARHPGGRIITYFRDLPAGADPEFVQDFAGKRVALLDHAGWSRIGTGAAGAPSPTND